MDLRSLVLVVLIFAASSVLAGYVGMTYWKPVAPQQMQPAIQSTGARPSSKPEASVVPPIPARETTQPQTLQSASEKKIPQEVQPPAKNTMELGGSSVVAPRTTGSTEIAAPKCNKEACANAYRSFDAGDCTYQPANGPRRLCNKK